MGKFCSISCHSVPSICSPVVCPENQTKDSPSLLGAITSIPHHSAFPGLTFSFSLHGYLILQVVLGNSLQAKQEMSKHQGFLGFYSACHKRFPALD